MTAKPRAQSNSDSSQRPTLPHIVNVDAEPETHTIVPTFATGERRRYDVSPLLDKGIFRRIQEANAFMAVYVDEMGGIVWEAGSDLSRDTVYLAANQLESGTLLSPLLDLACEAEDHFICESIAPFLRSHWAAILNDDASGRATQRLQRTPPHRLAKK